MKTLIKLAFVSTLIAPLAACTQTEQNTLLGAGAGAAAGQLLGGNTESTVAGAVIGGAAGYIITDRQNSQGQCLYRYDNGTTGYGPCA